MQLTKIMIGPIVYDKAKYHQEGKYPVGLSQEQAFVHTGMFLGWIIDHHLYSDEFYEDFEDEISAFKNREITGPRIYEICDGVFADDMLNSEGNAFTQYYFDFETGSYVRDYHELLSSTLPSFYHVEDTWENYEKLKKRIDQRYEEWKARQSKR